MLPSNSGSITVTNPPSFIVALATPRPSVVVCETSVESAFWKYTGTPIVALPPLVTVTVTMPVAAASGAGASRCCGLSGAPSAR